MFPTNFPLGGKWGFMRRGMSIHNDLMIPMFTFLAAAALAAAAIC